MTPLVPIPCVISAAGLSVEQHASPSRDEEDASPSLAEEGVASDPAYPIIEELWGTRRKKDIKAEEEECAERGCLTVLHAGSLAGGS